MVLGGVAVSYERGTPLGGIRNLRRRLDPIKFLNEAPLSRKPQRPNLGPLLQAASENELKGGGAVFMSEVSLYSPGRSELSSLNSKPCRRHPRTS